METEIFNEWVILELMGHRRLAGKATESNILGGPLLRLDIPTREGGFVTQYIGGASIYAMTPTTEAIARSVAIQNQPEPVSRWELPQLQAAPGLNPSDKVQSPDGLDMFEGVDDGDEDD